MGEGAKRTRGLDELEGSVSGISGETLMVRGQEKHRQADQKNDFAAKCLILRILNSETIQDIVLKSCCVHTPGCENINYQSSPKLLIQIFAGSLRQAS